MRGRNPTWKVMAVRAYDDDAVFDLVKKPSRVPELMLMRVCERFSESNFETFYPPLKPAPIHIKLYRSPTNTKFLNGGYQILIGYVFPPQARPRFLGRRQNTESISKDGTSLSSSA